MLAPYAVMLIGNTAEVARQAGELQSSSSAPRLPTFSATTLLKTIAEEPAKYAFWYFGLITNATPNPILAQFKSVTILGYLYALGKTVLNVRSFLRDESWARLLVFCFTIPAFMAIAVANKSHTYIINSLPAFALIAGVAVVEIARYLRTWLPQRVTARLRPVAVNSLFVGAAILYLGVAAHLYSSWLQQMRSGLLATYEETAADIVAAIPPGPLDLFENPVFLMPGKLPGVRQISTSEILSYLGIADQFSEAGTAKPREAANAGGDRFWLLRDGETFDISSALPRDSKAYKWRTIVADYLANSCQARSIAYTANYGRLDLYECSKAGRPRPAAAEPNIFFGGHRLRVEGNVLRAGPADIAAWSPYPPNVTQTAEQTEGGVRVRGVNGGGVWHTVKAADIGLKPGDFVRISVHVSGTSAGDLLSVQGDVQTKPQLLTTNAATPSWYSLASGNQQAIARLTGASITIYIYSGLSTAMLIEQVSIDRLAVVNN
jgi:hypothetical protein